MAQHLPKSSMKFLATLGLGTLLYGCHSNFGTNPPVGVGVSSSLERASVGAANESTHYLYVRNANNITIYTDPATRRPILQRVLKDGLDGGAAHLTFDNSGTLYAVNPSSRKVILFPRGSTTRSRTISTGLNQPQGIAISNGRLYVSGIRPNSSHDPTISVVALGSTSAAQPRFLKSLRSYSGVSGLASRAERFSLATASEPAHYLYVRNANNITIYTDPPIGRPLLQRVLKDGLDGGAAQFAFDDVGTLYAVNPSSRKVVSFVRGSTTKSQTFRTGLNAPISIAIRNGQMYVSGTRPNSSHVPSISVLALRSASAAEPRYLKGLRSYSSVGGLAFDTSGRLWFAAVTSSGNALYYYPSTGDQPRKAAMNIPDSPVSIEFAPNGDVIVITSSSDKGTSCLFFHRSATSPYARFTNAGFSSLGGDYEPKLNRIWVAMYSLAPDLKTDVQEFRLDGSETRTIRKADGSARFVAIGPTF